MPKRHLARPIFLSVSQRRRFREQKNLTTGATSLIDAQDLEPAISTDMLEAYLLLCSYCG